MMEQVLSNTSKILVDQKGGNNLLYLPLDKLIQSEWSFVLILDSTRGGFRLGARGCA